MKRIIPVILLSVTLGLPLTTLATGTSVGNGGNVVVCDHETYKVSELLDVYEAKLNIGGWKFETGKMPASTETQLEFFIQRLAKFSPVRAQNYRINWTWLRATMEYSTEPLDLIDDIGNLHAKIAPNCSLKQVAYQVPKPHGEMGKQLIVDSNLFGMLRASSQAALILHELITEESAGWGNTTSEKLRPFVAFLASNTFERASEREFLLRLSVSGIKSYEHAGLAFSFVDLNGKAAPLDFHRSGNLATAFFLQPSNIETSVGSFTARNVVEFDESGEIKTFELARLTIPQGPNDLCLTRIAPAGTKITIESDGKNHRCRIH